MIDQTAARRSRPSGRSLRTERRPGCWPAPSRILRQASVAVPPAVTSATDPSSRSVRSRRSSSHLRGDAIGDSCTKLPSTAPVSVPAPRDSEYVCRSPPDAVPAGEEHQLLVAAQRRFAATHDHLDRRPQRVPILAPALRGGLSDGSRVLVTEVRQTGVVVDLHQLRTPEQQHRKAGIQHGPDRCEEFRRPAGHRPQWRCRPVGGARSSALVSPGPAKTVAAVGESANDRLDNGRSRRIWVGPATLIFPPRSD